MIPVRLGIVLVCLLVTTPAHAQPAVAGRVKIATGSAFIVRQNNPLPAKPGDVIYESDGLKTGSDGRLGVTLKDDTRISLDPNAELSLDRFVFAPAEGRFAFVLKVVQGIVAYVSGRIARLAPDSVHIETPDAIIGIRGTHLVIRVGT